MSQIKELKTTGGKIKPTAGNLKRVTIKKKILTPQYKKAVQGLIDDMDKTTDLTDKYFASQRT